MSDLICITLVFQRSPASKISLAAVNRTINLISKSNTKSSSLSRLLEQMHTKLCQNHGFDEYVRKHVLFPTLSNDISARSRHRIGSNA